MPSSRILVAADSSLSPTMLFHATKARIPAARARRLSPVIRRSPIVETRYAGFCQHRNRLADVEDIASMKARLSNSDNAWSRSSR